MTKTKTGLAFLLYRPADCNVQIYCSVQNNSRRIIVILSGAKNLYVSSMNIQWVFLLFNGIIADIIIFIIDIIFAIVVCIHVFFRKIGT